jgi:anti-anti-sigma regulatory factor
MTMLHEPQGMPARAPGTLPTRAKLELVSPVLAVLSLTGSRDPVDYDHLKQLLDEAAAHGDVLVDLTRCASLDATAIGALIAAHGAAMARGNRLALLISPEQNPVTAAVHATHLADIVAVHTSRRGVFASFRRLAPR